MTPEQEEAERFGTAAERYPEGYRLWCKLESSKDSVDELRILQEALAEQRRTLKEKLDKLRCLHHPTGPMAAMGWNQALDAAKQAILAQEGG